MWHKDKDKIEEHGVFVNKTLTVNIIRHGKTSLNERRCYVGRTDESLSKNGVKEIQDKKSKNIYKCPDKLFVSPMKRARESAAIMFDDLEQNAIENFREMDFGSFEGKNYDDLKDNMKYRRWIDKSRGASIEEIESLYGKDDSVDDGTIMPEEMPVFYERVLKGFDEVLLKSTDVNEVSIVAHGGIIMAILSSLTKEDYYSFMLACGDGISVAVDYSVGNEGNVNISRFSVNNRICP